MIWTGVIIGVLGVLALQGVGLLLVRQFQGDGKAEAAEASSYWFVLTAWPFYLIPFLRDRRRRRTHES